jgi:Tol biopolymer transport system component
MTRTLLLVALLGGASAAEAAFPGPNGKIAYSLESAIWVTNQDGTGRTAIFAASFGTGVGNPAWSPDGTRIAFSSSHEGDNEIYVMNADGSGVTRLTSDPRGDTDPSWSPDGERLVFSSRCSRGLACFNGEPYAELTVINADGTGLVRITSHPMIDILDTEPAWSPEGPDGSSRIAFRRQSSGIMLINPDGSGETSIAPGPHMFAPNWSPDGLSVAFEKDQDLAVMNADGTGVRLLTPPGDGVIDTIPAWSPDGVWIVFLRYNDVNNIVIPDLYVVRATGGPFSLLVI